VSPSRRIVRAAAASSADAWRATDRGCVVFARSWARWRPRSRKTGAGPSRTASTPSSRSRSSRSAASGAPGSGPETRIETRCRNGGELEHLASLELPGEKPGDVVVDSVTERRGVGLEGLHDDAPGCVAPAAARELGDELERPLLGAEVREREAGVGVDDGRERDAGHVVALRDHLRPDEDGPLGRAEALEDVADRARPARDVRVEPEPLELGEALRELRLEPLRPGADPCELDGAALRAFARDCLHPPAVVAVERVVGVQRERDVAVHATARDAAGAAVDRRRDTAPVEEQDRPPAAVHQPAERGEERGRERVARLAAQVDEPHGRHRRPDPRRERQAPEPCPALGPRRRGAVHGDRALEGRPLGGDRACVVAGVGLLLVRGVVLLVDDDQPDAAHRREHGRPGADDDPRLAPRDPVALVAPLRRPERRVHDRDAVAEPATESSHRLRRERDLRHEHDRPEPALERRRTRLEVDLRLAAAGRPLQQDVLADALVECRDDPLDRRALLVRQRLRLGLAAERLALDGRRSLAPRRAALRRDELERSGGRRAVVVRHPQRQVDEGRGHLVEQPANGRRLDPGRRLDAHVRYDPTGRAPPEPDRHDGALRKALGNLVGEGPDQRPGGDERVDGGQRHGTANVAGSPEAAL